MKSYSKHTLSKSTFMSGIQCEKKFYLGKNHKKLNIEKDKASSATEAIFAQGNLVGELALKLFPDGVDATPESYYDFQKSVLQTDEFIENGETIIYEAAFQYNGVLAAMDILVKSVDGWRAYEVKNSTSLSDTYRMDAALQYHVITNSGIELKDISIVYINNEYVRQGELDINKLFTIESVLEDVKQRIPGMPDQIRRLKTVLSDQVLPEKEIGPHCNSPYDCEFIGNCWKDVPEYSVFDIKNLRSNKKWELFNMGAVTLDQVPEDYSLGTNQLMQISSELNQTTIIDKENIQRFIREFKYPLYHLDFETFAVAVPLFDGTRPYRQTVFQYSLHIQESPGSDPKHLEYLAEVDGTDPRIKFVDRLIEDCGTTGDILVYNIGFERGRLKETIEAFPNYATDMQKIIDRLKDLMIPFQQRWYYTPEMRGSYSIKKVLPALVKGKDVSYKKLVIGDGGTASSTFSQMLNGTFDGDPRATRQHLLAYCKLDTYAMVQLLSKLEEV
ncbi:MAG: DUF2779 domain-containing protein [Flavobacteriales bacterium]|nr:DUF2779 domain-containing protein [Flavobacteriales bacterium]